MSPLKNQIEKIKREHAAKVAEEARQRETEEERRVAADKAQAANIVDGIPDAVREALEKGHLSVELWDGKGVGTEPIYCTGVPGEIYKILRDHGLYDRLWVDRDLSGGWSPKDRLMFKI